MPYAPLIAECNIPNGQYSCCTVCSHKDFRNILKIFHNISCFGRGMFVLAALIENISILVNLGYKFHVLSYR